MAEPRDPLAAKALTEQLFVDRRGAPILIRRAIPADAEHVVDFVKATDTESTFLTREAGEFAMAIDVERRYLAHVDGRPNAIFLTAWDAGALVATLDFHGGNRRRTGHAGEFGLAVRRSHWGRGLGGRLLDVMLAWAGETGLVTKVKLKVQVGNQGAIGLYRSRGFVEEGCLRAEIMVDGEPVDVLAMARFVP